MKLNPDCMRAVMLEIENTWELDTDSEGNICMGNVNIQNLYKALPKYTKEDIFYSVYNLHQAGYLDVSILWADGGVAVECDINFMTYYGHEFLNRIHDPKCWAAVKGGLSAVRNYSLDAINSIASGITSAAIAAYLEKNPII